MKYIVILFSIVILSSLSCTDSFEDYNKDKKNPSTVNGNALFTNGQKELSDQINQVNVNQNIWKYWAQHWTAVTYTDEANYDIITRNVPLQIYRYYYRTALRDFQEAYTLIGEEEVVPTLEQQKQNRLAIVELLNVYAFQNLVDIFGMAIYFEALDIENVYPKYDEGSAVYEDLIKRVDAALGILKEGTESFGTADLYYDGDVSSWIKFGNSLKVKLGITIADSHTELAKSTVESAVAAGCFSSLADDCEMPYTSSSPNQNPLYEEMIKSGRKDHVPANTMIDKLHELNDPRIFAFAENPVSFPYRLDSKTKSKKDSTFTGNANKILIFKDKSGGDSIVFKETPFTIFAADSTNGMKIFRGGIYGQGSSYAQYSHVKSTITEPTFPGLLLGYTELQFYLAEAAARNFNVGGTAESFYEEGIKASFEFWGVSGASEYILANPYEAAEWKKSIGTQSWIANYTKGLVAYTTWRRLDYPELNIAPEISDKSEIPMRFTFPVSEQTLNKASYESASAAIGGDLLTTKIFWDKF